MTVLAKANSNLTDRLSNGLSARQSPAGKNFRKEAEDIIGIRYQATTDEDIAH
jgi:hypothetical protein